jgi:hypothetical protein
VLHCLEGFPGLIGYWPLDERSGTVAADSSSSSKNGTLVSMDIGDCWKYVPDENKPTDRALLFDKISDEHATIQQGVWINGDFTIESWVYLRSNDDYPALISFGNSNWQDMVVLRLADKGLNKDPINLDR